MVRLFFEKFGFNFNSLFLSSGSFVWLVMFKFYDEIEEHKQGWFHTTNFKVLIIEGGEQEITQDVFGSTFLYLLMSYDIEFMEFLEN